MNQKMRVAIIGTGRRAKEIYLPVLLAFSEVEVAGVCGRNIERTKQFAGTLQIPVYTSIEHILNDETIDCIIVCVDWAENANIYQQLEHSGKPCLLETPLGHNQEAIERTFNSLAKRSAFTDIAEQYHLRPIEVLKRKLLATGIFGDLVHAYNDGMGHEYHGVSLIRSYVGFDKSLIRALSMQADVPCFAHKSHKDIYFPGERIINSILEFSNGVQATFHWSWLNYKSPIRSRRSSGFYATKGAAWGPECVVFTDENSEAKQIYFERRTLMVKGMEILTDIVATLDSMPIARWSNPFYQHNLNEDQIVTAFFVENLLKACGDKLAKPLYSPYQAYQDHLIVDAMHKALA